MKTSGPDPEAPTAEARRDRVRVRKADFEALEVELKARTAEAEWLKVHYDEHLRSAFAQIASLQARMRDLNAQPGPAAGPGPAERAELERLRAEVARLAAAESRYLDRIEELKEAARRDQP